MRICSWSLEKTAHTYICLLCCEWFAYMQYIFIYNFLFLLFFNDCRKKRIRLDFKNVQLDMERKIIRFAQSIANKHQFFDSGLCTSISEWNYFNFSHFRSGHCVCSDLCLFSLYIYSFKMFNSFNFFSCFHHSIT